MLLELVRYFTLFLLLCNIPGYLLVYYGPTFGAISSYLTSLLLIAYFVLIKSWHKPAIPFIVLGLLYFSISGLSYSGGPANEYLKAFLRFMIVVICAVELLHRTKKEDLFYFLLIGAVSVIINALIFPYTNALHGLVSGRFSGFYLNPNSAGTICSIGFALSYSMPNKWWRYIGQFAFTLGGLLTLSRTFVIIWLLINLIAIFKSKKNLMVPIIGALVLVIVLTFTDKSIFAGDRFAALESFFGDGPVQTKTLKQDSRTATWALYYDLVFEKPFIGHGHMKFQRFENGLPGVHNSFLMVIGESGIIPFIIFVGIYGHLLVMSFKNFKNRPELFYVAIVLSLSLMVGHGYFFNFRNVILAIYLYIELKKNKKKSMAINQELV